MYLKNKTLFVRRKNFLPVVVCAIILFLAAAACRNVSEKPEMTAEYIEHSALETATEYIEHEVPEAPADQIEQNIPEASVENTEQNALTGLMDQIVQNTPKAPDPPDTPENIQPKPKYLTGEDPELAARYGWPVKYPELLAGSILPDKRIVAYYGTPRSKLMGVLGQYPKDEMLARLKKEVDKWEEADPAHKVQPALHLIAVVAQDVPGTAKRYRNIMPDSVVEEVYEWAREAGAIMFIDIQAGHDDIRDLLPRFEWILKKPDVHLAIDPEFYMISSGKVPGTIIGTIDARDVNYVSDYLGTLVKEHSLPPKVFVIHRFTRNMVTNSNKIILCPEVAIVMHMDGWGAPSLKRSTYRDVIIREPVQFTGFKLFYHNDTKNGHGMLEPHEIIRLIPAPLYIQYQ